MYCLGARRVQAAPDAPGRHVCGTVAESAHSRAVRFLAGAIAVPMRPGCSADIGEMQGKRARCDGSFDGSSMIPA